jgi:hypothetical protein
VADLTGTRRRVRCHRVAEAHGEQNLVGVSWIGRVRLERSEVGRSGRSSLPLIRRT